MTCSKNLLFIGMMLFRELHKVFHLFERVGDGFVVVEIL